MQFLKALVLLTLLFSHVNVKANDFVWGSLGMGLRIENDTESSQQRVRNPFSVAAGLRYNMYAPFVEYSTFKQKTGNQTLEVSRRTNLWLFGLRVHPFYEQFSWYPYFSAAVGPYWETINVKFIGETREEKSLTYLAGSLGVGVWGEVWGPLRMGGELRALACKQLSPKIQAEFVARIGVGF